MGLCKALYLTVHLLSVHGDMDRFNNGNYGAGVECQAIGPISFGTGVYYNSFNTYSAYVASGFDLVVDKRVSGGIVLGLASGYKQPVTGGIRVRYSVTKDIKVGGILSPGKSQDEDVFHLFIQLRSR